MGLQVRRRVYPSQRRDEWVNVSTRGVSASKRVGHVTVNTRGSVFVRTGIPGVYYRFNIFRMLFGRGK